MPSDHNNEDSLVTFLSGFNQVFLTCLLANIIIATCLGEVSMNNNSSQNLMANDYDFEIKTALERTKNHSTFIAMLFSLTVAAVVFVSASRVVQNARRLNLSILDIAVYR